MLNRRTAQTWGAIPLLLLACSSQDQNEPSSDAIPDVRPDAASPDTGVPPDAVAPDTRDGGMPIWNADSRGIDVTCGAFGLGSMRFVATRDQLSPTQVAQLSLMTLVAPSSRCIADGMACTVSITQGDETVSVYNAKDGDYGCSSPDPMIPWASFDSFRRDLSCLYSGQGSPGYPAPAIVVDGRCRNGISLLRTGPIDRTLSVSDPGVSHHLDLDDCDRSGQAGKVHLQLLASGDTTPLAEAQPVSDPGPDHTCLHLDYTFPAAGTYHINVVVDADYQPALDLHLRFY